MRQYLDLKREAVDALLFFRMGDFYELFFDDAREAAEILDIAVSSRQKDERGVPIPMAGVPWHAAESYIARLVRAGRRVAVCDQVEPAGASRGPVRREIVRVATPSTYLDPAYLEGAEPAYLMAVAELGSPKRPRLGAAWADLSTGDFTAAEFDGASARRDLAEAAASFRPRELLLAEGAAAPDFPVAAGEEPVATLRPEFWFAPDHGREALLRHFGTASLEAFGVEHRPAAAAAAGAALTYLRETQRGGVANLLRLKRLDDSRRMGLDGLTQRNLELFRPLSSDPAAAARGATLVETLDRTSTAMGARLLRRRLAQPLMEIERIRRRHQAVDELRQRAGLWEDARAALGQCPDLERLASRTTLGVAGPREYLRVAAALGATAQLREALGRATAAELRVRAERLDPLPSLRKRIEATVAPDAPALARDGGVIRQGFSTELDELRGLRRNARETIRAMEARERTSTGIQSLRVRYNKVFGYTIEVAKSLVSRVPGHYQRRQTLVNAERFVTEELREFESRIATAEERIATLEAELFRALEREVGGAGPRLLGTAAQIAATDVAVGLAEAAARSDYVRPDMHDGFSISVRDGRHPVVEALGEDPFAPNDLALDRERFLMVLTGPNMGGKSTFLRQTALIAIMAQAGSLVPARKARLPLVDRVFARVGASDDLSRGRSTFLTEMEETAHILHHATPKSLVLLDEVGRGTATWDGLSLAWAVVEHIARTPGLGMKTLFATHYHELTELAEREPGVVNFHVEALEHGDGIAFLRQVIPGGNPRSYGIAVARLAGVPATVVRRAREVLDGLAASGAPSVPAADSSSPASDDPPAADDAGAAAAKAIAAELRGSDPDGLTPRDALDLLYRLRRRLAPDDAGTGG